MRAPVHAGSALLIAVSGCGESAEPRNTDGGPKLVPGVCFGQELDCNAPEFEPLDPTLATLCLPEASERLELVWRTPLGSVGCPAPACPAIDAQIAASDGDLWSLATVKSASNQSSFGESRMGFQLSRFDANGNRTFMSVSDLGTRLSPPLPSVEGLVQSGAGVLWLAPTAGRRGLELRRHGAQGERISVLPVVDAASAGTARWFDAGSWVVAHTREDAEHRRSVDVSRFAASGELLWNRASIVVDAPETSEVALTGTDALGQTTLALSDRRSSGLRLLRLDALGNVVWARAIDDVASRSVVGRSAKTAADADGAVLVVYTSVIADRSGVHPTYAQRIAADGAASWRVRLGDPEISAAGQGDVTDIAADAQGRWLLLGSALENAASTLVVASDGSACTRYTFDAPAGVQSLQGDFVESNFNLRLSFGEAGALHFATALTVGTVRLP